MSACTGTRQRECAHIHTQHLLWAFPQVSASQGPSDTAPVPEVLATDGPGNGG